MKKKYIFGDTCGFLWIEINYCTDRARGITRVSAADGRDEEDWPGRPTRGAGDVEARLQQRPKQVRQALIRESFVAQSLNSDFSDVSIRYLI